VVVAGSYHAGVFALAGGVPVVGLARSAYYVDKFRGLADQFGHGCEVVLLKDEEDGAIETAIEYLWQAAEDLRPHLLAAAADQIAAGHRAYRKAYEIAEAGRR
jgi:colanic acid/amylovoran biosynthesis protein